jgi:GNAT superfamily N-acetyltransferase
MGAAEQVSLREATERDAGAFLELKKVYWDETFRALGDDATAERYLRFEKRERWAAMIAEGLGVLAENAGVVGGGMLVPCYGEPVRGVCPHDPSRWELLVYVVPQRQGRGTGSRLTAWLEERARRASAQRVFVDVAEPDAGFFERRGYRRSGVGELGGVQQVFLLKDL